MSARIPRPKHPTRPEPRPTVTVAEPGDLVAAVPYLVGFTPQRSLVVVSLRGERLRCGVVARADLPGTNPEQPVALADLSTQLVGSVLLDEPEEAVLMVYDDNPFTPDEPQHQDLVEALSARFAAAGVGVKDALYLTGDRFWSYRCQDPDCCSPQGRPLDHVLASPVAATLVAAGRAPLPTRDDLRRRVRARGQLTSAAVGYAASVERQQQEHLDSTTRQTRTLTNFGLLVLRRFTPLLEGARHSESAPTCADGGWGATPAEAGAVLAGLADIHVRDALAVEWTRWLRALPSPTPDTVPEGPVYDECSTRPLDAIAGHIAAAQLAEGTDHASGFTGADAELFDSVVADVLLDLATLADGELAVPALVLLAMQAWAGGEGALANVAIERSLRLNPDYRMAHLVDQLLCRGIAPRWVREQQAAERRPSH